jgi:hypothetical protein
MTVNAYLALLVGVFVVALVAVSLDQRNLVGDLAGVARDVTRDHAPKARAARELRAAHLVERHALAGFLVTAEPAESVQLRQARRDLQRWRADLGARLGGQEDQTVLAEFDRLVAEEQAAADQAVERAAPAGRPRPASSPTSRPTPPASALTSCSASCRRRPAASSTPTRRGPACSTGTATPCPSCPRSGAGG